MAYHHFAKLYDQLMDHAPYDEWVKFTEEILRKSGKSVKQIVDLGCGTGEITLRLANAGYQLIGVDLSTEMLTLAADKSGRAGKNITWLQQDIRKLTGLKDIEVMISYCDVLNYITTEADVLSVFENVFQSLAADGMFIFDIHSLEYAETRLREQTFTDVEDNLAYIWDCEPGEAIGEMFHYITFFAENEQNGLYERFDELHHQQVYPTALYVELLKEAGFSKIEIYNDFKVEKPISQKNVERFFIVAQKEPR